MALPLLSTGVGRKSQDSALSLSRDLVTLPTVLRADNGGVVDKRTVIVTLSYSDDRGRIEAVGEAPIPSVGVDRSDSILRFYERVADSEVIRDFKPERMPTLIKAVHLLGGGPVEISGLEIALHDLYGKLRDVPVYRLYRLGGVHSARTSITVQHETDRSRAVARAKELYARGYDTLKFKAQDGSIVETIRAARAALPRATIRVDANGFWDLQTARASIDALAALSVELIEEPLAADSDPDGRAALRRTSPIPLIADESCRGSGDVARCAAFFHGVNVKLEKAGGIRESIRTIRAARSLGLLTMVGCYCSTSIAITAAASICSLADYVDLDGSLLLRSDPYAGVTFEGGRLALPRGSGLGVTKRTETSRARGS